MILYGILAVLSLSENIFNVKKLIVFVFGYLKRLFILDFNLNVYGKVFLDLVKFIIAIREIVEWKRGENKVWENMKM